MHPVELAGRIIRQADLLVTEGAAGPTIPNVFSIGVHPKDLPDVDGTSLDREMTRALAETAAERGWRTSGPITVAIHSDDSVGRGSITCAAESMPGPQPAWAQLVGRGGAIHDLGDNRVVVGRSSKADITLDQPEVSRFHAVIFRRSGGIWVMDLGSANGTRRGGEQVSAEAVGVLAGDLLEFGPATFALRLA